MWRVEAARRSPQLERESLRMCEGCHGIMCTREAQLTQELSRLTLAAAEQRELAEELREQLADRVRELQRVRSENERLRRRNTAQTEQVARLRVAAMADAAAAGTTNATTVPVAAGARRRPPVNSRDGDVGADEPPSAQRGRLRGRLQHLLWRQMVRGVLLAERHSCDCERIDRLEQEKIEARLLLQHVTATATRLDLAARTIETQAHLIEALEDERDLARGRRASQVEGLPAAAQQSESATKQLDPEGCHATLPSATSAATPETAQHARSDWRATGQVAEAEPPAPLGTPSTKRPPTMRDLQASPAPGSVGKLGVVARPIDVHSARGEAGATEDMWGSIEEYKAKHLACDWSPSELPVAAEPIAAEPVSSKIPAVAVGTVACAAAMKLATALQWLWTASPLTLAMHSALWLCWCRLLWVTWGFCHESSAGRGAALAQINSGDESDSKAEATTMAGTLGFSPPTAQAVAAGATMLTIASCCAMPT